MSIFGAIKSLAKNPLLGVGATAMTKTAEVSGMLRGLKTGIAIGALATTAVGAGAYAAVKVVKDKRLLAKNPVKGAADASAEEAAE